MESRKPETVDEFIKEVSLILCDLQDGAKPLRQGLDEIREYVEHLLSLAADASGAFTVEPPD
jgi:hypothetical protein